ncbi:hypothetical protein [Cellulosimicrobium sp. Marseille-Q8652]
MSPQQSSAPHDRPDDGPDGLPADRPADAASGTRPPAGDAAAVPADEVEIEDVVDPTTVRRAPRYRAFFTVGIVLGVVVGLGVGGAWLQSDAVRGVFKPGVYFSVILLTCTALGAAVAGVWAVVADRRSLRGRR